MKSQFQKQDQKEKQSFYGHIAKVSGTFVVAEGMKGAKMNEIVKIGYKNMKGQIVKLVGDTAFIQCFDDTVGMSVGDLVFSTKQAFMVELGPGILNHVFDGTQRPLQEMAKLSQSIFIPQQTYLPTLDPNKLWEFAPRNSIKEGDMMNPGDIFGCVAENGLFLNHSLLVPPISLGKVTFIAPPGNYSIHDEIMQLQYKGIKTKYSMHHKWPVRRPRPIDEKLNLDIPLVTGIRVIDSLFPLAKGGTCCIPGTSGCGKNGIIQSVMKDSGSDVNLYIGCGERGNEIVDILEGFPSIILRKNGKDFSLMEKSCILANTSNFCAASKEISIYTGMTIAQYFRDMGKDVAVIADSTSRWAEALREISINMSEISGPGGYPIYLGSRIAQFYQRAGSVKCLGQPNRKGSITLIGTVSPRGGDFDDPVVCSTMANVQAFWALDKKVAQMRHFPSINWNKSTSNYCKHLSKYYEDSLDKQFSLIRKKLIQILNKEREILEIQQSKGYEYLTHLQRFILELASIVRFQFLQQNVFSPYDSYSPLQKTSGMMKAITTYYDLAFQFLRRIEKEKSKPTVVEKFNNEREHLSSKIRQMKFQDPRIGLHEIKAYYTRLVEQIKKWFEQNT